MADAKTVYNTLIKMLDAHEWKYQRHDEDFAITCGARGEDLPIDIILRVQPKPKVVQFISVLPCKMPEDKRVEGALAVCTANYGLVSGSFDYDLSDGEIRFRITNCYGAGEMGEDMLYYMLMLGASTVDEYNDRFLMLSKGLITIEQFLEKENN